MAAKVPAATTGNREPYQRIRGGVNPITTSIFTVGTQHGNKNNLRHTIWRFSGAANDIDDGDTWESHIPGIVAVAWQAAQADTDIVACTLTNAALGTITFKATNAGSVGFLHVFSRG